MVTIYDIAKLCKVSPSTVSRALNNNKRISSQKRQVINEVAANLGYIPNFNARHLSLGSTNIIGVIMPHSKLNHYYELLINGILENCDSTKYQIILLPTNYNEDLERHYLNMLKSKALDSVILCSTSLSYAEIETYTRYGYIVSCEKHTNKNISFICTDRLPAYLNLINSFPSKYFEVGITFTRNRYSSMGASEVYNYFSDYFSNFNEKNIVTYCRNYEDGFKAGKYFSENHNLKVIFANSDEIALGIKDYYEQFMRELTPVIVGQDCTFISKIAKLPSVNFFMEDIGKEAYKFCECKILKHKKIKSEFINSI
ncbi:LacI family DNA-binding transcriptional regulator [Staphylococcus epidermidis]|nr:LacI family DNA-binding transcriptional regulator [Staphylococcus epidermidis]